MSVYPTPIQKLHAASRDITLTQKGERRKSAAGRPATGRKRPSLNVSIAMTTLAKIERLALKKECSKGQIVDQMAASFGRR